jgi:hypothetical protein
MAVTSKPKSTPKSTPKPKQSSAKLTQKAAGYLLAAANAQKANR